TDATGADRGGRSDYPRKPSRVATRGSALERLFHARVACLLGAPPGTSAAACAGHLSAGGSDCAGASPENRQTRIADTWPMQRAALGVAERNGSDGVSG